MEEEKLAIEKKIFRNALISVSIQALFYISIQSTVVACAYQTNKGEADISLLIKLMYLYDSNVCPAKGSIKNVTIEEPSIWTVDMEGYNLENCHLISVQQNPHLNSRSSVAARTRRYCVRSIIIHSIWLPLTIIFYVANRFPESQVTRVFGIIWCLLCLVIIGFDLFAGYDFTLDVQRSVTKMSMLAYTGFSGYRTFEEPDEFVGWIPLLVGAFWMRFYIGFGWNIWLLTKILDLLKDRRYRYRPKCSNHYAFYEKLLKYDRVGFN